MTRLAVGWSARAQQAQKIDICYPVELALAKVHKGPWGGAGRQTDNAPEEVQTNRQ